MMRNLTQEMIDAKSSLTDEEFKNYLLSTGYLMKAEDVQVIPWIQTLIDEEN